MKTTITYFADFVLVPLYALAALLVEVTVAPESRFDIWGIAFVAGWFAWTFAEYAIHRWVFHVMFPRQHWLHHLRPKDMSASVSVQWWHTAGGALVAYLATVDLFGLNVGTPLFMGLASGYWAYAFLHFAIHHCDSRPSVTLGNLIAIHMQHHRGVEGNFGVQTSLWDKLLGTYVEPRKNNK